MKRKSIQKIIILAIVAIIGIVATQLYWIKVSLDMQKHDTDLHTKRKELNEAEFNDRVKVALKNVAEKIQSSYDDPAEMYRAVEQLRPNYYVVRVSDTLNPFWLEQLLKREFDRNNVSENYRYGIYDCFTDSVVYSDIVITGEMGDNSSTELKELPQVKWDTDAHYFSITFPDKDNLEVAPYDPKMNAFVLITIATLLTIGFIAYALWVIFRQKRLSEIKTDFINNMTHELKTPISTISLSSEVLLRPDILNDPDRIKRYAGIIHDENARLQGQVERVLQLAKLDKEEVDLKVSLIDIHEIIESSAERFDLQVSNKNGSIILNLGAEKSHIEGDIIHITNIIYNLLDNANKYCPENPEIQIYTKNVEGGIEIRIKDNGIGMGRDALKLIFTKFYRVPTGNVHDVKGFGLGLYYVKELLNKHGGLIRVNSAVGSGSTFVIWLPNKQ